MVFPRNTVCLSRRAFAALFLGAAFLWPLTLNAQRYQVLHSFGAPGDGSVPAGPLAAGPNGSIYGTTGGGGSGQCSDYGCGTVFELNSGSGEWQETIVYNFAEIDGSPWGSLVSDMAGNLYGTTLGPVANSGVYELSPASGGWSYAVVYDQGAGPGVAIDSAGDLYGSIGPGADNFYGAIGALTPNNSGWSYTDLATLNPTVGYDPPAPPIPDGRGGLLGITEDGGIVQPACWIYSGCGVIFVMTPESNGTWGYKILHEFASFPEDGQSPSGGLVRGRPDTFYGLTDLGGPNNTGTVFEMSIASDGRPKLTLLYDFPDCSVGCYPDGTMAIDRAGNLYGVAGGGIADCGHTCGVIFRLAPQADGNWEYSVVHKFTGTDGAFPWGVILDNHGNLFGITEDGGTYNAGVAFEISPGVYPVPTSPDAAAGEDED